MGGSMPDGASGVCQRAVHTPLIAGWGAAGHCDLHGHPGDLHDPRAALTLACHRRAVYGIMGSARGVSSVAMNTSIMEQVPQHFMGRVQNTFYFAGTALQIIVGVMVGAVAQYNLVAGFSIIGLVYVAAFVSANGPPGLRHRWPRA